MAGFWSSGFVHANDFRPMLQVGCLMDIQTGRWAKGLKGENILNGGVAQIEGTTGPGNSMKSTFMHYRLLQVLLRYAESIGFVYDTENSATRSRYIDLANWLDPTGVLAKTLEESIGRFGFTDATSYDGTAWFEMMKGFLNARAKSDKKLKTPILDLGGKQFEIFPPIIGEIDSFSQFFTGNITEKQEKNKVGSSEMNAVSMQASGGKAQVLDALPSLTGRTGLYVMMSAHMGDTIVIDQYNAPAKKLAFVKNTRKMKKVPESFTFLTNNLFEILSLRRLVNASDKCAEFPRNENDTDKENTDLMIATIHPIRTKSGITGIPMDFIFSQTDGLQVTLTEFYYCRSYDRFGLNSNPANNYFEIYPDVRFSRKNIRDKIRTDSRFRRAAEITADLCQINNLMPELAVRKLVEPAELYKGLIEKGYDWNVLLDTRPYWTFDQYTNPVPFLSTLDLLEMYHGEYHPYWMPPLKDK